MNLLKGERRAIVGGMAGAVGLGAILLAASCGTTSSATIYTPFTGLRISSALLFAGYTCGLGPGQVYAYVAVVSDAIDNPQPAGLPVANVYACGNDGAFQNIPGSGSYTVNIYAYDRAAFPAELACTPGACALPPTMASELGNPTWTTTCSGLQEGLQNALVVCNPLTASGATPEGGASPAADASPVADGAADATMGGGDGGTDAGDGGSDAGDGATSADGGGADGADEAGDDTADATDGDTIDATDAADAGDDADAGDGM